jgi:YD repeat-containing protein
MGLQNLFFYPIFMQNRLSMKNPVFLLLLSLYVIPACKKNTLPAASGNTLNKIVTTIPETSPFQTIDSFVYDGQQRLAEVILSGSNPTFADTVTFQYDASGRVLSWTQVNDGLGRFVSYELSYDGNGHIVKATAVPLLAGYEFSDYSFAYNALGQLITDTTYAQHIAGLPSAGIMSYNNWTYDEHGNAIAEQFFISSNTDLIGAPFKVVGSSQYQYDTQTNPYYHAGIPLFTYGYGEITLLSPNNVVGGTTTETPAEPPYTYSYAYYNNGRPRIQTSVVFGLNETLTQTTTYFYQ